MATAFPESLFTVTELLPRENLTLQPDFTFRAVAVRRAPTATEEGLAETVILWPGGYAAGLLASPAARPGVTGALALGPEELGGVAGA